MRNLKKILALALALVMSMSLMATANAFSDDEDITGTYKTAVDVLSGLKVFQGYDDGSFQPKGPITRAEVAAIIYRIVTGDVNDTQKDIYADYNKFDDVKSTSWYAGYVNFCANAEYIKGYDATHFGPNDPVTGYQALAMILRALGYDKNGEFTGTNWTIQTAAVGESQGITKNITAGTLNTPATREVVAEILFQAILVPKATYTPAFGYQTKDANGKDNTSIGWDTFKLEDITGVVVANEYADLYSDTPLKAGKTELVEGDESYVVDYATEVVDLGEARHVYLTGETVLAIADGDNTVWTNEGAEADIATNSKCVDASGLKRDDTTEDFVNFADASANAYEADIRIVYSLDGTDVNKVSIKAGATLTSKQYNDIKNIFTDDDYADGWVVVGTKYTAADAADDDISNDMTFRNFVKEYLVTDAKDVIEVKGADNGEWLKVIDNDGDGVADYIFRIDFAMSVIDRISRDGEYTLADLANDDEVMFTDVEIDESEIKTEDELAEGDVVIYTLIDGNYYMSIAEMVTETIDKKGINSKTETITCDGTEYVQSHIGYTDESVYKHDVTDAHTEWTYDLYLDHFNNVRLFIESDYDAFMLLTDGWYENDRRVETFQAMYWDVEADEETQIDVVDDADVEDFIKTGAAGDEETWGNLWGADDTYLTRFNNEGRFITNIAGYAETDDGYVLQNAEDTTNRMAYDVQGLNLADFKLGAREMTADNGGRIQATTNTQYYLVIKGYDIRNRVEYVEDVITWTGYSNTPDEAALESADAYAVTHDGYSSVAGTYDYDIADVVVFESDAYANRNTYFVYEHNNWNIEYVWGLGYDEDGEIKDLQVDVDDKDLEIRNNGKIEFYEIYDNETVNYIGDVKGEYAAKNIYAGRVEVLYNVGRQDYIQVRGTAAGTLAFNASEIDVYCVSEDGDYTVDVADNWDDIDVGDRLILFTDGDKNVEYALWVEGSLLDKNGNIYDYALANLWKAIEDDANYVEYDVTVKNLVDNTGYTLAAGDINSEIISSKDDVYSVLPGTYILTLEADAGYTLGDVYVTVNNIPVVPQANGNYVFSVVNKDVTVEINSKTTQLTYDVTADADTSVQATVATLPMNDVPYGTEKTFTVAADAGYSIEKVEAIYAANTDEGVEAATKTVVLTPDADGVYTLTVTADITIKVTTKANTNTVTFNYYNPDGALIVANTQSTTVATGATKDVVLGTNADEVYVVDDDVYAAGDTYEITGVTADVTIDVTVYPAIYSLTVKSGDAVSEPAGGTTATWTVTPVGSVATGSEEFTIHAKLSSYTSGDKDLTTDRTLTYKLSVGGEEVVSNGELTLTSKDGDVKITVDEPIFGDVELTVVSIAPVQ